jgi:hypothetical protein
MAATEVTNAHFRKFVEATPAGVPSADTLRIRFEWSRS